MGGMNFQIDLRELRQQYPVGKWNTRCFFSIRNFLELMDLKPLLSTMTPKAEPSGRKETGLEKIFRHVLGIGLDKTQSYRIGPADRLQTRSFHTQQLMPLFPS